MQRLTLEGFSSCEFLPKLTNLEELVLRGCNLDSDPNLAGLTKLRKLTCTSYGSDRSLAFINHLTTLEELNLGGMVTYEDVSGIFMLPQLKKLYISGMECEIDFDKITDNPSLESLEMAGIKLYENVQIEGGYGIVSIDWDDVYLADHLDFVAHFPNLKKLDVADNKLENVDFAAALMKLEEIDLSDNYVTDLHTLADLPALRELLRQDAAHLDSIQADTASAREFALVFTLDRQKEESARTQVSRLEKSLRDQSFHVRRAGEQDLMRLLAVYYQGDVTTEIFDNIDGERWVETDG